MSISCMQCGAKVRVDIHGGEFLVREGSTLDLINFEKVEKIDFEKAEVIDEDVMLRIEVYCSADPSHMIFAHAKSKIKQEIYKRIEFGARRLRAKNS